MRTIFSGLLAATSSISTPPSALAMITNLAVGPVEDDAEIELARDIDAGRNQDLIDLMAANVHPENCAAAADFASAGVSASLMPPALPRPPE